MRLKQFYWRTKSEAKVLALWFLCTLPRGPGVWARGRFLGLFLARLGEGTVIQDNLRVNSPENVSIGAHCSFGEDIFITGGGGVTIGDYVGLGPDVKIWSVNHRFADPDIPWMLQGYEKSPVVIEDDVWLGANTFVKPGITVGKGAIVSAGTILSKSVPPFSIVAGNPGRVVGWRKRPEDGGATPTLANASGEEAK